MRCNRVLWIWCKVCGSGVRFVCEIIGLCGSGVQFVRESIEFCGSDGETKKNTGKTSSTTSTIVLAH